MDLSILKIAILVLLSALFGIIASSLTKDEFKIYRDKIYFPLFKILFSFISLILWFINKNFFILSISILILIIFWDQSIKNLFNKK